MNNIELTYNGVKIYKLKQKAYDYYRLGTRNNEDISFDEARRKLTRNIMCAVLADRWSEGKYEYEVYMYGAQKIKVVNGLILMVRQMNYRHPEFELHRKTHKKLSKRLGLE